MNKFILILTALLFSMPILSDSAVNAGEKPKQSKFSWLNIFSPLSQPKPPIRPQKGVSRGDLCLFSPDLPNEETRVYRVIWSTQPLFLWQGKASNISLYPESEQSNNNLWNQPFASLQNAVYTGNPLQAGQKYRWKIDGMFVPFQVMEEKQRNQITAELRKLENQLKAIGSSLEDIASAKANYFVQRGMWPDALQQAYAVQKPSPELAKLREEIPKQLCKL
jgi:hypothetical protein